MSEAVDSAAAPAADEDKGSKADGEEVQQKGRKSKIPSPSPSVLSEKSETSVKKDEDEIFPEEEAVPEHRVGEWNNMRRIIAEDTEWSLATVPMLHELVVNYIVDNFENNSLVINDILEKYQRKVLKRIPTSLPLKVTALLVEDEGYWERCCRARWEICNVAEYGNNWKRMYFERNLQGIIELFVPETTNPLELDMTVELSSQFIKRLDIRQLLPPVRVASKCPDFDEKSEAGSEEGDETECDHFNFDPLVKKLPYLEELHLTYGVKDCGMNFEWHLFQFTARDCLQLSECVAACKTLKIFHLHRSKVDDDKVRVLINHLLDHPGIVELDLSHNIIGDRGARAIGKFLNNHSELVKLNLCNNQIRSAGAQAIAHALTKNTQLLYLNLRLNRLGDEGGQAICRALLKNRTLLEINLGSNDLVEPTAAVLSQVLIQNNMIRSIDLSCNRLGPDGGKQLQEGMGENTTIIHMDLRLTECGQEAEYCISQILFRNQEADRKQRIKDNEEANAQYRKKNIEPQAAHRYVLPPPAIIA